MDRALAPPSAETWARRAAWFWKAHDVNAGPAPLALDSRAELLLGDLESAFCAGAWSAVILLAWALVEDVERRRAAAGDAAAPAADVDWLRERRNRVAHGGGADPWLPSDERAQQGDAEAAVRLTFKALFAAAWR
ncbi:MAG: hypothetical protein JNK67_22285 [Alphaproteobacteria bacterium]|nr:hypothetical protein [Alphaproteobacteria bacterium]